MPDRCVVFPDGPLNKPEAQVLISFAHSLKEEAGIKVFPAEIQVHSKDISWIRISDYNTVFIVDHAISILILEDDIPQMRLLRSEEHTSELQSRGHLVCRLLLEKKKKRTHTTQAQSQQATE